MPGQSLSDLVGRSGGGNGSRGHIYVVTGSPCRRNLPFDLSTPPGWPLVSFVTAASNIALYTRTGDPRSRGLKMPDSRIHVSVRLG